MYKQNSRTCNSLFATLTGVLWICVSCTLSAQPIFPHETPFEDATQTTAPDYRLDSSWAALPQTIDVADLAPGDTHLNLSDEQKDVDVFYVHPTGYLSGRYWTSPLLLDSAAEENTQWMLAYQASIFNACCNVYAPRYREASIYAYLTGSDVLRDRILDVAYQDVRSAFKHFIAQRSQQRPIVIASHSQGTHHALRLIAEEIDDTQIAERLVVAYTLGATVLPVTREYIDALQTIKVCASADETHCFVHWDVVAEEGVGLRQQGESLCVNPLSWRRDQDYVPATEHKGALPIAHHFNDDFGYDNSAQGLKISALKMLQGQLTGAQCVDGTLTVSRLSPETFVDLKANGNYHLLDYPLFYDDIRINVAHRIARFNQPAP